MFRAIESNAVVVGVGPAGDGLRHPEVSKQIAQTHFLPNLPCRAQNNETVSFGKCSLHEYNKRIRKSWVLMKRHCGSLEVYLSRTFSSRIRS